LGWQPCKWEFAARDVDSDNDDEEPELVDGVDFNVYLTRRLFDLPNRTHLDLRLIEAEDAVLLARETTAMRRLVRLAEKHHDPWYAGKSQTKRKKRQPKKQH
jgi:hypothetical protein